MPWDFVVKAKNWFCRSHSDIFTFPVTAMDMIGVWTGGTFLFIAGVVDLILIWFKLEIEMNTWKFNFEKDVIKPLFLEFLVEFLTLLPCLLELTGNFNCVRIYSFGATTLGELNLYWMNIYWVILITRLKCFGWKIQRYFPMIQKIKETNLFWHVVVTH